MTAQVRVVRLIRSVSAHYLLLQRFDVGRQQSVQAESGSFFVGKCGSLVPRGRAEQLRAEKAGHGPDANVFESGVAGVGGVDAARTSAPQISRRLTGPRALELA